MIIRKKDEDHILDAHHYGKGPEDKGHDPENIPLRQSNGMMPVKTLLDGVKRARAYIAINHTQGAEGEQKRAGSRACAVRIRFHRIELGPLSSG